MNKQADDQAIREIAIMATEYALDAVRLVFVEQERYPCFTCMRSIIMNDIQQFLGHKADLQQLDTLGASAYMASIVRWGRKRAKELLKQEPCKKPEMETDKLVVTQCSYNYTH